MMNAEFDHTERKAQNEAVKVLCEKLRFEYLGFLDKQANTNIRENDLMAHLTERQHLTRLQALEVISSLKEAASLPQADQLYDRNKKVYQLLTDGIPYSEDGDKPNGMAQLINWDNTSVTANTYALAEEVTVNRIGLSDSTRRPDIVLYVNGIALVVLELKRSAVSVADAIRQNRRNQQDGQIPQFFTTVQLLMAGNPSQGLHYGVIKTPEEFFIKWRQPVGIANPPLPASQYDNVENELHRSLLQMLDPKQLLEYLYFCIIFDGGVKKAARPNQYFALKAFQERVATRQGGVIWHSQGSGKSLTMVCLAKWILKTQVDARSGGQHLRSPRLLIITDRDELDTQITQQFQLTGFDPHKATSCQDLIRVLNNNNPAVVCTLLHKFGIASRSSQLTDEDKQWRRLHKAQDMGLYLEAIAAALPNDYQAKGNLFVFVDECHRTQGGNLNQAMRKIVGDDAMIIGFTGTPLLHVDKEQKTTYQNFGDYIHQYTFKEAVADNVILDLRYESRNVDLNMPDRETVDELFNRKTRMLNDHARELLKNRWIKMQVLYNNKSRMERVVFDVLKDMMTYQPLDQGYGNAMLVTANIPSAYKYWEMFQNTELKGHVAVVTSYDGHEAKVDEGYSDEVQSDAEKLHELAMQMFDGMDADTFEESVKLRFKKDPASMKLLIVVDKLLTGFDAPSCTYLYIDRKLQDHNLFQAICRTNRKNGAMKDYGYIIDYRRLFTKIQKAVADYNTGALSGYEREDVEGLLSDRLAKGREDLQSALDAIEGMDEYIAEPRKEDDYFDYYCYNSRNTVAEEQTAEINKNTEKRENFYNAAIKLARCYASLSSDMTHPDVGFTKEEADVIYRKVRHYDELRHAIMLRSGDFVDLRRFDAQMRDLLDRYVVANRSEKLGDFGEFSFLDIVTVNQETGDVTVDVDATNELGGANGVAETMAANVRRVINTKRESDPVQFKTLSARLNQLIEEMRQGKIEYQDYLKEIINIVRSYKGDDKNDPRMKNADNAQMALYRFFDGNVELALLIDTIAKNNAGYDFRTQPMSLRKLRRKINEVLPPEYNADEVLNIIVANDKYGN